MFYHVQTHRDIPLNEAIEFRQTVDNTLNDPRSWGIPFHDVTLEIVLQKPKKTAFLIRLTPTEVMNQKFQRFRDDQLSVANMTDRTIDINYCRWTEQCPNRSALPLEQYRQYVIQHEVGHILGKLHPTETSGQLEAPVMMQQTLGIGGHTPNPWPTELDRKVL